MRTERIEQNRESIEQNRESIEINIGARTASYIDTFLSGGLGFKTLENLNEGKYGAAVFTTAMSLFFGYAAYKNYKKSIREE